MSSLQVVVMGVSATGKSTVGHRLAEELGWTFVEGDDLHPRSNVAKMESGEPLTDADRAPWLDEINRVAREHSAAGRSSVLTCSALKRSYRDRLSDDVDAMFFVHLHADYDVLEPRMQQREKHFMPTGLLRSQFDTLELLGDDEDGAVIDVAPGAAEVVGDALVAVRARLDA
ncbi:Gluconokinase [Nocardioides aquaticus]|uniref:Gluconokinase n=1 Tax=Nocardioides aquaticus TaxID=160826 RepID=A0ABX8EKN3_9ACTN|nr:gluconokinase [Nocardioides aquaticus]QVT79628.1 Gluconokinase [Nocardioides aquaticus]